MSDVPQRPRIRPATSDDWHKGSGESAGQTPSYGNEADRSSADFDNSTYYEYLERHTGEQSISKARSGNVFAPAGRSPFDDAHSAGSHQYVNSQQSQRPAGGGARNGVGGSAQNGAQTPPPPQFPPTVQNDSSSRNGLKIAVVIIAILMVLALVGFFGIRWLAPSSGTVPVDVGSSEPANPSPSPSDDLAIDDGEFVITSGQSSPLLQSGVTALDDVAALVLDRVELRRTTTPGPAPEAMAVLIGRFGDDGLDLPRPQQ
jgi:hypothetical protein